MRVLFVTETAGGAQEFYRCRLPAYELLRRGHHAAVGPGLFQRVDGLLSGVDEHGPTVAKPTHVVLRMVADPRAAEMVRDARKAGQWVAFDIDDDVWNLPPWNPAASTITNVDVIEEVMAECDAVLASTAGMAESVAAHTSTPVTVCRAGVDLAAYRPHPGLHEPLRVGWMGLTGYRGSDLHYVVDMLADVLADIHTRSPVEFWHFGARVGDPPVADILPAGWPVPVVTVPWCSIVELPRVLGGQVDVAVVPQKPCRFAESRAYTTGLAWLAAGVPIAASMTGEYRRLSRARGVYELDPARPAGLVHLLADAYAGWRHPVDLEQFSIRSTIGGWLDAMTAKVPVGG